MILFNHNKSRNYETSLSVEDIKAKLVELRATYSKTRLAHKISPVENPIQIRDLRRTIARLETELTNKQ